jgi:hypothetical protein
VRGRLVYLKSLVAGIVAAVAASILYILTVFVFPVVLPFILARFTGEGGATAGRFSSGPLLVIAFLAFAAAFAWQFRRARRPR